MLEGIYQGIQSDIGTDAAKSFVNMVGDMVDDASATTFLQSLERLEFNQWRYQEGLVPSTGKAVANAIANQIQDTEMKEGLEAAKTVGENLVTQSMVFGFHTHKPKPGEGLHIIMPFLKDHAKELDKDLPKGVAINSYGHRGVIYG